MADRELFARHEIFCRSKNQILLYHCLENLSTGLFTILQMSLYSNMFSKSEIEFAHVNFNEIFMEFQISDYTWSNSISDAIHIHDQEFENAIN